MTTVELLLKQKPNRELFFVSPEQSTYAALELMEKMDVGAIPVQEGDRLIGILTERDYARKIVLCGKTSRHTAVRETMRTDFPTVSLSDTIDYCMQLMTNQRFRYVAAMDGARLVGLVSVGDVVKHVIATQQANIDHLERYITGG